MAIDYILTGTNPNDGTGDDLRSAFLKVNANFEFLDIRGGEENRASNYGNDAAGRGIFFRKGTPADTSDTTLYFKRITGDAASGIIVVDNASGLLTITNVSEPPATITRIVAENEDYLATLPDSVLNFQGQGYTTVTLNGNTVTFDTQYSTLLDTSPQLGGDLDLNNFNITGTGNLNNLGSILTNNITVGRPTQAAPAPGTLQVYGNIISNANVNTQTLTAGNITVNNGAIVVGTITAGTFNGPLTGNSVGTHKGNITRDDTTTTPPTTVTAFNASTGTFTGNFSGPLSGSFAGSLASNLNLAGFNIEGTDSRLTLLNSAPAQAEEEIPTVYIRSLPSNPALFSVNQITNVISNATEWRYRALNVELANDQYSIDVYGRGPSIGFTSTDLRPGFSGTYDHGTISMGYDDANNSAFAIKARTNNVDGSIVPFVVSGKNYVQLANLEIDNNTIKFSRMFPASTDAINPANLVFDPRNRNPNSRISFYGAYRFPDTIGLSGQVLSVPPSGNILTWITPSGGGGGGGVTYFTALLDGPGPFQTNLDENRVVAVNSTATGLVYADNISVDVTGDLTGNASTATRLATPRTINGVSFDGSTNITLTTNNINEPVSGATNLYFTNARGRGAVSVAANKALTYSSATGIFDLNESTEDIASTLVKRDANGLIKSSSLQIDNIDVLAAPEITINSNITGSLNLSTSGTLTADNFATTGVGIPTFESAVEIVMNPTTYLDLSSKPIQNLGTPTLSTDATTKGYVDGLVSTLTSAAMTQVVVAGDSGGTQVIAKGATVNVNGSGNIVTQTTSTGISVTLRSQLSNISVTGALPVNGNITATQVKGGNINLNGNNITQTVNGNNIVITPGPAPVGGSAGSVEIGGSFNIVGSLAITTSENISIPASQILTAISADKNMTFITTTDWLNDSQANLAYAQLAPGRPGQIKTILMASRGQFGRDALSIAPRYLVLSGTINGASRSINVAETDPNGCVTLIYLNGSWWKISEIK